MSFSTGSDTPCRPQWIGSSSGFPQRANSTLRTSYWPCRAAAPGGGCSKSSSSRRRGGSCHSARRGSSPCGQLPELLYEAKRPFASSLVQQLAWVEALQGSEPGQVQKIVSAVPAADDLLAWLPLGEMLSRLHHELAADGLDFPRVTECGSQIDGFREAARWQALAEVQKRYLDTLDRLGLWDQQTANLVAIRNGECRTKAHIVLVGTADLNRSQRMMLDQVADRVTALVCRPGGVGGTVRRTRLPLPGRLVDTGNRRWPISRWRWPTILLTRRRRRSAPSWASVGATPPSKLPSVWPTKQIVPYLRQRFEQCALPARYGVGTPIARSAPYRLLACVADYVETHGFSAFAALVRHPWVNDWLCAQRDCGRLAEPDGPLPYRPHAPRSGRPVAGGWQGLRGPAKGLPRDRGLCCPLRGKPRRLADWAEPILDTSGRSIRGPAFGHGCRARPDDPGCLLEVPRRDRRASGDTFGANAVAGERPKPFGSCLDRLRGTRFLRPPTAARLKSWAGWNCRWTMRRPWWSRDSTKAACRRRSIRICSCRTNFGEHWALRTTTAATPVTPMRCRFWPHRVKNFTFDCRAAERGRPILCCRAGSCSPATTRRMASRVMTFFPPEDSPPRERSAQPSRGRGRSNRGWRCPAHSRSRRRFTVDAGYGVQGLSGLPLSVLSEARLEARKSCRLGRRDGRGRVRDARPRGAQDAWTRMATWPWPRPTQSPSISTSSSTPPFLRASARRRCRQSSCKSSSFGGGWPHSPNGRPSGRPRAGGSSG